jgi:hypothetical protein
MHYYVNKTLLRYEQSATKLKCVAVTHIFPQDPEATFITIFRSPVSISDSIFLKLRIQRQTMNPYVFDRGTKMMLA